MSTPYHVRLSISCISHFLPPCLPLPHTPTHPPHAPNQPRTHAPLSRFELAVQLGDLDTAQAIAVQLDSEPKWKQLGEMAMMAGRLKVAEECLRRAKDFSGLMLMHSAHGDADGMSALAVRVPTMATSCSVHVLRISCSVLGCF